MEVFQSPSLRGSGRFTSLTFGRLRGASVSIPFIAGQWSLLERNGAIVIQSHVSIPFIAGQWSLRRRVPHARDYGRGFNPLHCGAVVASSSASAARRACTMFQSPSLRGSGRFGCSFVYRSATTPSFNPLHCGAVVASRSPYGERGSASSFNPLHCGAVVASRWRRAPAGRRGARFQSPSLRGSGRFPGRGARRWAPCRVSIPFIAGQWSLRARRGGRPSARARFNPLHCGAVVASVRPKGFARSWPRFNPLHCGAVVASGDGIVPSPPSQGVSIPFIAGQWSLLPRTTPSSLFGVLLRKRRLPCDHIICTRLPF